MADSNLPGLTRDTSPATGAILYVVLDPDGTPLDRGVAIENLFVDALPALGTPASGALLNCTGLVSFVAADESTDTTCFPLFVTAATGELGPKTGSNLTFDSNTGVLGATTFSGAGTSLTGTAASLTAGNVTTNANLTGHVTSVGNSAVLGAFTAAQLNTAISDDTAALISDTLAVFAATTSLQLLGVISDETGTGALCFAISPTLVTPALGTPASGVLTNVTGLVTFLAADESTDTTCFPLFVTAATGELGPKTGSNLTFDSNTGILGATTFSGAGTSLTGTAASLTAGNVTTNANLTGHVTSVGNGAVLGAFTAAQLNTAVSDGTVALVADTLAVFAATTSLQLLGVISDETGSGALMFATSPTITTSLIMADAANIVINTTTGTKIGTATTQKLSLWGVTPVVQPTALTSQETTITFTEPGGADYALQDVTNSTPYGFVDADELRTFIGVVENLQVRVAELETKLQALGALA